MSLLLWFFFFLFEGAKQSFFLKVVKCTKLLLEENEACAHIDYGSSCVIHYLFKKVIRKKHWDLHLYEAVPQSRLISGNYLNYFNHIKRPGPEWPHWWVNSHVEAIHNHWGFSEHWALGCSASLAFSNSVSLLFMEESLIWKGFISLCFVFLLFYLFVLLYHMFLFNIGYFLFVLFYLPYVFEKKSNVVV